MHHYHDCVAWQLPFTGYDQMPINANYHANYNNHDHDHHSHRYPYIAMHTTLRKRVRVPHLRRGARRSATST